MTSVRKRRIRALSDQLAAERDQWIARNAFYYEEDERYTRFVVPPGRRILDLGCGNGRLLAALQPSVGVGVDFSPAMVEEARRRHPDLDFRLGDVEDSSVLDDIGGPFDVVILSDTIGSLDDVQATLASLHSLCTPETRILISYYNRLWAPVLRVGRWTGQQMPSTEQNWLSRRDIAHILRLADFDVVRVDSRQLLPKRAAGFGRAVNRFVATLPGMSALALRSYVVARSAVRRAAGPRSVSVVIPARNEEGNIFAAVARIPRMADDQEIVFVEGHSTDETAAMIERVIDKYPELDIKLVRQPGVGKADAVRAGFDVARGDLLMILDADLTTPPEDLPKFYDAIVSGKGELVMGSRLVYPLEEDAMRALNTAGNKLFSLLFSWMLHQRITDTLCGTKVLTQETYARIEQGRQYFGDFDPFGDFDLIFGAAKQNLKIVEIPVRYRARTYGTTQISRFRHGLLLARMTGVAYRRLKAL